MNGQYSVKEKFSNVLYIVYGWMSIGLAITSLVAYGVSINKTIFDVVVRNPFVLLAIILAQLAIVIVISLKIRTLSYPVALSLFLAYSALVGLSLSIIFVVYTTASIFKTFLITSLMFATMALYGYFTRSDLSSLGSMFSMALWGLIIALIVNLFLRSTAFDMVISFIGIIIFAGLTAFDVQKIKQITSYYHDQDTLNKVALFGALVLYLDFINLFLMMLRFTGSRRE
ncbi:Bax inhibitor-1/YccA family protein [Candidatus Dependentiae bacterium]|nr:Bax inhibitor-1/YccA family protein [Candidatus Dependentiae bacterium]